jgi:hypothetical protein
MRTTTLSAAVHVAIIVFTLSVPARVVARPAQPARMLQFTADVADERGDECRGAEQGRRSASSPYGSTHGEAPRTLPPGPKRGGVVPGGRHEGDGRGLDDLNACMDATVEDGWLMGAVQRLACNGVWLLRSRSRVVRVHQVPVALAGVRK